MDDFERTIEVQNWENAQKKTPKLHEYPQHLLTEKERIRVESFLRRHPQIVEELKQKEWEKEKDLSEVELEDLPGQIFDSEGRPEFDRDGLSIDYND